MRELRSTKSNRANIDDEIDSGTLQPICMQTAHARAILAAVTRYENRIFCDVVVQQVEELADELERLRQALPPL
jgi:hypothetical protein